MYLFISRTILPEFKRESKQAVNPGTCPEEDEEEVERKLCHGVRCEGQLCSWPGATPKKMMGVAGGGVGGGASERKEAQSARKRSLASTWKQDGSEEKEKRRASPSARLITFVLS